jgi:hypothetical protein
VETNIHHPTDSSLLADSPRVMTRYLHGIVEGCQESEIQIVNHEARIFQADAHHPDKILSLFEPHSVVIRKGKAHKPNEFGRLVRIDEVEKVIVSNYFVAAQTPLWHAASFL